MSKAKQKPPSNSGSWWGATILSNGAGVSSAAASSDRTFFEPTPTIEVTGTIKLNGTLDIDLGDNCDDEKESTEQSCPSCGESAPLFQLAFARAKILGDTDVSETPKPFLMQGFGVTAQLDLCGSCGTFYMAKLSAPKGFFPFSTKQSQKSDKL